MGGRLNVRRDQLTLSQRIKGISITYCFLICLVAAIGFAVQYSVADGSWDPYASRQMTRFAALFAMMLLIAVQDMKFLLAMAYPFYFTCMGLLILVELGGIGPGATRWIDLGFMNLQPSEVMKIALVMALARYFHSLPDEEIGEAKSILPPLMLIALPAFLVLRQPDLGTATLLIMSGAAVMYLGGINWRWFAGVGFVGAGAAPFFWQSLHVYQQNRILTFLEPERDPLGAGYHILQSQIALGSGGIWGRGYLQGTQSHLEFLPENQTDFIFSVLAEEFGLAGTSFLVLLYAILIGMAMFMALQSKHRFGRLMGLGVAITFFLYAFINIAMVAGLLPVVGVPLPLISYGGSSMLTILLGFGLLLAVHSQRDVTLHRMQGVLV